MEEANTSPRAQEGPEGMYQLLWHITTHYSRNVALSSATESHCC